MWTRVFGEIDDSQIRNLFIADQMLEVINVHFKHKRNKLNNKIGIFNIDYSTKIEFNALLNHLNDLMPKINDKRVIKMVK